MPDPIQEGCRFARGQRRGVYAVPLRAFRQPAVSAQESLSALREYSTVRQLVCLVVDFVAGAVIAVLLLFGVRFHGDEARSA